MSKEDVALFLFYVLFMLFVLLIAASLAWGKCKYTWQDTGYESKWQLLGGCKVRKDNGPWIPAKNLREMNP
jgi:hypothetical protein